MRAAASWVLLAMFTAPVVWLNRPSKWGSVNQPQTDTDKSLSPYRKDVA